MSALNFEKCTLAYAGCSAGHPVSYFTVWGRHEGGTTCLDIAGYSTLHSIGPQPGFN